MENVCFKVNRPKCSASGTSRSDDVSHRKLSGFVVLDFTLLPATKREVGVAGWRPRMELVPANLATH